jgi:hypothetical protein
VIRSRLQVRETPASEVAIALGRVKEATSRALTLDPFRLLVRERLQRLGGASAGPSDFRLRSPGIRGPDGNTRPRHGTAAVRYFEHGLGKDPEGEPSAVSFLSAA